MNPRFYLFLLLLLTIHTQAFQLKSDNQDLQAARPLTLSVTVTEPADQVQLELRNANQPLNLNGTSVLTLTPSADRKTFTATLLPETLYHPSWASGRQVLTKNITAIPVITRQGQHHRLPPKPLWNQARISPLSLPFLTRTAMMAEGRFGRGYFFDGRRDMAAVNQFPFNPQEGTIEFWCFLPLLHRAQSGVICFVQTSIGHGQWRYHLLDVPAHSRKVRYLTYNGQSQQAVSQIITPEIDREAWVHVRATFSLKTKTMELFLDGISQGTASYTVPCAGKTSDLNLGGRVHFKPPAYDIISPCQMLLDELRISDTLRQGPIPQAPLAPDDHTCILLNADQTNLMRGRK